MTLFSDNTAITVMRSFVLAEKGVTVDWWSRNRSDTAELGDLNPYNTMPTLVDRAGAYESKVMMEYLDERFHPCCCRLSSCTR